MKKRRLLIIILVIIFIGGYFILINEKDKAGEVSVVEKLYQDFDIFGGSIDECIHNGNKIYLSKLNAYDAGSGIYDEKGNSIGICNYAWGGVDSICGELENCINVYMSAGNIWGQPAVDKYGLER